MEKLESMVRGLSMKKNSRCADADMLSLRSHTKAEPAETLKVLKHWATIEEDNAVILPIEADLLADVFAIGSYQ